MSMDQQIATPLAGVDSGRDEVVELDGGAWRRV